MSSEWLNEQKKLEIFKQCPLQDLPFDTLKPKMYRIYRYFQCTPTTLQQYYWEANSNDVLSMPKHPRVPWKQAATTHTVHHIHSQKNEKYFMTCTHLFFLSRVQMACVVLDNGRIHRPVKSVWKGPAPFDKVALTMSDEASTPSTSQPFDFSCNVSSPEPQPRSSIRSPSTWYIRQLQCFCFQN